MNEKKNPFLERDKNGGDEATESHRWNSAFGQIKRKISGNQINLEWCSTWSTCESWYVSLLANGLQFHLPVNDMHWVVIIPKPCQRSYISILVPFFAPFSSPGTFFFHAKFTCDSFAWHVKSHNRSHCSFSFGTQRIILERAHEVWSEIMIKSHFWYFWSVEFRSRKVYIRHEYIKHCPVLWILHSYPWEPDAYTINSPHYAFYRLIHQNASMCVILSEMPVVR